MSEVKHVEGCGYANAEPCPSGLSVHGEPANQHWWSGWPGAWCWKCGAEDPMEICVGNSCQCPCHGPLGRECIDGPEEEHHGDVEARSGDGEGGGHDESGVDFWPEDLGGPEGSPPPCDEAAR